MEEKMGRSILRACAIIALLTATASGAAAKETMTRLADAHTDACVYNYNQCMDGCGGASGCEGQCKANYDGCMAQGQ
jgi:predicted lipoprotein with Yx(FWY)xxD motif